MDAQTVIAVCAFLSLLVVAINWMLNAKIRPIENRLSKIESQLDALLSNKSIS